MPRVLITSRAPGDHVAGEPVEGFSILLNVEPHDLDGWNTRQSLRGTLTPEARRQFSTIKCADDIVVLPVVEIISVERAD
jgi:hypothetical protein